MVNERKAADTGAAVSAAVARVSVELEGLVSLLSMGAGSPEVLGVLAAVERAGRLMDAARVHAAAPLARDRLEAERLGFPSPVAAVATTAQISERAARARLVLAEAITPDLSISGCPLPPQHPAVATALTAGRIGLDAATLITRELDRSAPRVAAEARLAEEDLMVNLACGLDPTGQHAVPPVSVDYLSTEIRTIGAAFDPDGARPREERAMRNRDAWVGKQDDDGLVPFGGRLLPESGVLLMGLLEAWRRSPRFTDPALDDLPAADTRTPGQRRHDAFAEILTAAAATEGTPQLNGQPVTVVVSVTADDLNRADGLESDPIGVMAGSQFPVSRAQVENFIDGNGYREVTLTAAGAITGIGSPQRCFTPGQTRAIAVRDGYRCSRPGCTAPHTALQVHHVIPWRQGGATQTSNGILLCYWDHRRVDDGPWQYRMVNGLPEVRGPGVPEWRRTRPEAARAA